MTFASGRRAFCRRKLSPERGASVAIGRFPCKPPIYGIVATTVPAPREPPICNVSVLLSCVVRFADTVSLACWSPCMQSNLSHIPALSLPSLAHISRLCWFCLLYYVHWPTHWSPLTPASLAENWFPVRWTSFPTPSTMSQASIKLNANIVLIIVHLSNMAVLQSQKADFWFSLSLLKKQLILHTKCIAKGAAYLCRSCYLKPLLLLSFSVCRIFVNEVIIEEHFSELSVEWINFGL